MKVGRREQVCIALAAFAGTYGISYLMNLRNNVPFSFSVFTVGIFAALFLLLRQMGENLRGFSDNKQKKRRVCYGLAVSFVFGLSMVLGYQLQWGGYTEGGLRGRFMILLRAICLMIAGAPLVNSLFAALEKVGTKQGGSEKKRWKPIIIFLCSWAGIWMCWIPVWLAYYPVIMSYDFHRQSIEAVTGFHIFSTSQPLIHTWLIWAFRNLGTEIGSYQTAMGLFSLFQQMILSAVLGYVCAMLYRMTKKRWLTVGTAIFFGLFPLISVFAICSTKDVLFSAFFVLFILLLAERFLFSEGRRKLIMDILLVAEGVLMVLFRGNALYALLPFVVLLPLCVKVEMKERLRVLVVGIALVVLGKGALDGIYGLIGGGEAAVTEKYGVLIQCMSRTACFYKDTMPEETRQLLAEYLPEDCWEKYNSVIVDGVKTSIVYSDCLNNWEQTGQMLVDWVKIGLQYPNEYLDAILEVTRGYWFWDDTSHAEMLGVGLEERMGLLYTYNSYESLVFDGEVEHISKFPWLEARLENLLSANAYYKYPMISNLFKPALWIWLLLFLTVSCIYMRKKEKFKFFLYPLCYFATLILGPTAIIRYVYPILLVIPVLFALVCLMPQEDEIAVIER